MDRSVHSWTSMGRDTMRRTWLANRRAWLEQVVRGFCVERHACVAFHGGRPRRARDGRLHIGNVGGGRACACVLRTCGISKENRRCGGCGGVAWHSVLCRLRAGVFECGTKTKVEILKMFVF